MIFSQISKALCTLLLLLHAAIFPYKDCRAFQLSPDGTTEERKLAQIQGSWVGKLEQYVGGIGLRTFGSSVHEQITDRIYGCNGDICDGNTILQAPAEVLAGVRWNDDPPFRIGAQQGKRTNCNTTQTIRFRTQPRCWYQLFSDAQRRAAQGEQFDDEHDSAMVYRTHFGDLQYLHAMATRDNMPPTETQEQLIQWAEFSWRTMRGEFKLETPLRDIRIGVITTSFSDTQWTVQDLLTQGSGSLRRRIGDVAFGTLLHLLQDSFSQAHVDRKTVLRNRRCMINGRSIVAPGLIREFHSYVHQDHKLHARSDSAEAFVAGFQSSGNVVDVGRELLEAYEANMDWPDVKPFVECIFALSPDAKNSSAGSNYAKEGL